MCPCKQTSLWLFLVLFGARATGAVGYYNDVPDAEIQVDATGAVGAPNAEKGMSLIQSKMKMASSSASESHMVDDDQNRHGNHPHHHQHQKVDPPVSHLSQKEEEPEQNEDKVPEKVQKDMTEEEAEIAGEDKVGEDDENCKKSPWGKWGACTKTCASKPGEEAGKKVRHRNVEPFNCDRSFEEMPCANHPCPVDCIMAEWEEWGTCPEGCKNEGVKRNRTRTIKQKPAHGGQCCPVTKECSDKSEPECGPALLVESEPCGEEKQKCEPTPWSEWTPCSKTCNTGKKTRARSIKTPAKCGGAPCLCDFAEVKNCEHGSCVQQCELSEWGNWTQCPVTCGGSIQTRERHVIKAPAGGAPDCPPLVESKNCGMACCKRDCVVSSWDTWSFCSASCYGTQKRTRKVEVVPCGTGAKCEALFESRECNHDCVLPCEVGEWGPWGSCSATCGGGTKLRYRNITQQEANGGKNCPPLWEAACCEETNLGCPVEKLVDESADASPPSPVS